MDLILYKNFSVPRKLEKNLTEVARYPGEQLVEPVNDAEASIRMVVPTGDLRWDVVNYFEWDGAYYFLSSVDMLANGVSVVNGEMDLLMTYSAEIMNLRVLALRSTSHGSARLVDAARSLSVDAERSVLPFPNTIPDQEVDGFYVLTTAQAGYALSED